MTNFFPNNYYQVILDYFFQKKLMMLPIFKFPLFYGIVFPALLEKIIMAHVTQNPNKNSKPLNQTNKKRSNERDDLDSRKNEEQDFKGDDITHNKKQTESERKSKD